MDAPLLHSNAFTVSTLYQRDERHSKLAATRPVQGNKGNQSCEPEAGKNQWRDKDDGAVAIFLQTKVARVVHPLCISQRKTPFCLGDAQWRPQVLLFLDPTIVRGVRISARLSKNSTFSLIALLLHFNSTTQTEPAYCGLSTLVLVLNALRVDPNMNWKGPWRWYEERMLNCCLDLEDVKSQGITVSQSVAKRACRWFRERGIVLTLHLSLCSYVTFVAWHTARGSRFTCNMRKTRLWKPFERL